MALYNIDVLKLFFFITDICNKYSALYKLQETNTPAYLPGVLGNKKFYNIGTLKTFPSSLTFLMNIL